MNFESLMISMHFRLSAGTVGLNLYFDWDDEDGDDMQVQDASGNV